MKFANVNRVNIIGTVERIEKNARIGDNGAYIYGKLLIKSVVGKTMNIEVQYVASEFRKSDGKPSGLYASIQNLKEGQKISLMGILQQNKFWSQNNGQLIDTKKIQPIYLGVPKNTENDQAKFEYHGFVIKPLKEVFNKEGETVGYEIRLGQINNNGDAKGDFITFQLDPQNRAAIDYVQSNFKSGETIKVFGTLDYDVVTETRTETVDFGEPIVHTYQKNTSNLLITSGGILEEGAYTPEIIQQLLAEDVEESRKVEENAKNQEVSGAAVSEKKAQPSKTNVNQSLI